LMPSTAVVTKDTSSGTYRTVALHINAAREKVVYVNITISDSSKVSSILIDGNRYVVSGKENDPTFRSIAYTGLTSNGFDVVFEMETGKKLEILVNDRSIGLPVVPGFNTAYPNDIIPAQGTNANTIQVKKRFVF